TNSGNCGDIVLGEAVVIRHFAGDKGEGVDSTGRDGAEHATNHKTKALWLADRLWHRQPVIKTKHHFHACPCLLFPVPRVPRLPSFELTFIPFSFKPCHFLANKRNKMKKTQHCNARF
ncbi:hypothetical protein TraAM80_08609, partial [Trypanosoma rangeli]